jgi:hypothetical protein
MGPSPTEHPELSPLRLKTWLMGDFGRCWSLGEQRRLVMRALSKPRATKSTQTSRVAPICGSDGSARPTAWGTPDPADQAAGPLRFGEEVIIQIPLVSNGLARRSRQPARLQKACSRRRTADTRKNWKPNVIIKTEFNVARLVDMPLVSISISSVTGVNHDLKFKGANRGGKVGHG